jgi:hypothetical protein
MTLLSTALLATLIAAPVPTTSSAAPQASKVKTLPTALAETPSILATPSIPIPAGIGKYCSIVYPSGAWAFAFTDANQDPCTDMLASTPGGTVMRAGLWDGTGGNNVVYRCAGGGIGLLKDYGDKALQAAYDDALGQKSCVFTVAPLALGIFSHPFPTRTDIGMSNGFDFAHGFDVKNNSGAMVSAINRHGNNVKYNDHNGFDWVMPTGTKLTAMAKGRVMIAQTRNVSEFCPNEDELIQKEMFVTHVVGSGRYKEIFVAYYAHFDTMSVEEGDIVEAGTKLGTAGDTGCSTTAHLHLSVIRGSNTAAHYRVNLESPTPSGYTILTDIDPYAFSWSAAAGFDPWAFRRIDRGDGALSINLWKSGQAPKRD